MIHFLLPLFCFNSFPGFLQTSFPQARKLFLGKVHQYIKDRVLDAKYACAFLFSMKESKPIDFEEVAILNCFEVILCFV